MRKKVLSSIPNIEKEKKKDAEEKKCDILYYFKYVLEWEKGCWPMIESLELQYLVSLGVGSQQHFHEMLPCHRQELPFNRERSLNMIISGM